MNDITHTSMIQGACKCAVRPLQPYTFKSEHPSNTIESTPSIGKAINFFRPIKIWEMFLWRRVKIPTMGISPPAQVISSSSFNPPVIHFSIQVQNTRIIFFAKGDHAMSYQEDVVNCFQAALKTFRTSHEWYCAVKADDANPRSLACVLGLTNKKFIVALNCSITATRIKTGGWNHSISNVVVIALRLDLTNDCNFILFLFDFENGNFKNQASWIYFYTFIITCNFNRVIKKLFLLIVLPC